MGNGKEAQAFLNEFCDVQAITGPVKRLCMNMLKLRAGALGCEISQSSIRIIHLRTSTTMQLDGQKHRYIPVPSQEHVGAGWYWCEARTPGQLVIIFERPNELPSQGQARITVSWDPAKDTLQWRMQKGDHNLVCALVRSRAPSYPVQAIDPVVLGSAAPRQSSRDRVTELPQLPEAKVANAAPAASHCVCGARASVPGRGPSSRSCGAPDRSSGVRKAASSNACRGRGGKAQRGIVSRLRKFVEQM